MHGDDGMDPRTFGGTLAELGDPEREVDLRGMDRQRALEHLEQALERFRFEKPRTLLVRIDPPPPGGGETLFQPVGRLLLAHKRSGRVRRCFPLAQADSGGFYVELPGPGDEA